ncbi:MAG: fibronectin type III domain-containing protein [Spirochaetota bacterium]
MATQPGDRSVRFTWDDPNETDLESIEIQLVPSGGQRTIVAKDIGTAILANLTNGTVYQFRVQAVDTSGNRSAGQTINATPGLPDSEDNTPPGDASNLVAVPGDRQVALSWVPPVDIDCNEIILAHDKNSEAEISISRSRTSIKYAGLENGTAYLFTAKAKDLSGHEASGVSVSVTPAASGLPPGPVTDLSASAGDRQVALSWLNPAVSNLDHINIFDMDNGISVTVPASATSITIGGLTNGNSYEFSVVAVDSSGNASDAEAVSFTPLAPVPDITAPGPVVPVSATAGDGSVALRWTDPADDDPSRIQITGSPDFGTVNVVPGAELAIIGGLTNGIEYSFELVVIDTAGNESSPVTMAGSPESSTDEQAPDALNIDEALTEAGDGLVSLHWTNPVVPDLSHVEIRHDQNADVFYVDATRTSATLMGLTNGVEHTFSLIAVDTSGNASDPVSTSAMPTSEGLVDTDPPGPISNPVPVPGSTRVSLSWTKPADADLGQTEILVSPGDLILYIPASLDSAIVTSLTNGTPYTFTFTAVDTSGNRSTAVESTVTPLSDLAAPGEVTIIPSTASDAQVLLEWQEPLDEDLARILITSDHDTGTITLEPGMDLALIGGLENSLAYTFTIRTVDHNGNTSAGTASPALTPLSLADTTPPGPVDSLASTPGDEAIDIGWQDPGDTDLSHIRITNETDGTVICIPKGFQGVIIGGLVNGTTYTFSVVSVDLAGNESTPGTTSATPVSSIDETPPGPVNTPVASPGDSRVTLSWTDPTDTDLNHIEISYLRAWRQPGSHGGRTRYTDPYLLRPGQRYILYLYTQGC